ncbi:MAG: von Willebrand factor type A domain-containing protein [Pirellulales bacterium]
MNESSHTPDDIRDELHDRLTDQALGEALAGQRPPDLVEKIVAAAQDRPRTVWRRPRLALAASLLLAAGLGAGATAMYFTHERQVAWQNASLADRDSKLARSNGHARLSVRGKQPGGDFESQPAAESAPSRQDASTAPVDPKAFRGTTAEFEQAKSPRGANYVTSLAPDEESSTPAFPDSAMQFPKDWNDLSNRAGSSKLKSETEASGARRFTAALETKPNDQSASGEQRGLGKKEDLAKAGGSAPVALAVTPRIIITEEEEARLGLQESKPGDGEGRGPGEGGDRYSRIVENEFLQVKENPLSTFSIDVDTASYAKSRRYIEQNRMLPPPDAVRIEEFVNYFSYGYAPPADGKPFAAAIEVAACPWRPAHRLVRVGLKGRDIARDQRPTSNLVFLLDVSGSMESEDKLPRVRRAMRMLVEQLGENDRVAIAVYAGASGLVLPSTLGTHRETIVSSLDSLRAGGSTNGASGIQLAYDTATANFIKGGTNRVILCTDGDFNVGTTSTGDLERLIVEKAKTGVFLTVLGFGMGNHNDDMLEKLADKGNGNYGYIDSEEESRKMLVDELGGTLVTIAKDVKLQIEFNPARVAAYRLVGYENRILAAEDFNDDKKDAGEIGEGHTVTALYEVIPVDAAAHPAEPVRQADPLRYQKPHELTAEAAAGELLSLKIRYKDPDAEVSHDPQVFAVKDEGRDFGQASADFQFAAAVASYAMILRGSRFRGETSLDAVLEIAQGGLGEDKHGYRASFLQLVRNTKELAGE